jgi:aryl-alcohol dehydrogenase-like predicted oxidoreductase
VGTWQFGGEWGRDFSERDVDAIIGAAGDAGVNLIDTAAADLAMVTEEHPQAWGQ